MRETLEDWANDPMEFMGVIFGVSILAIPFLFLATTVVSPHYEAFVGDAFEWIWNILLAVVVATMIVGTVDGDTPGAARVLVPLFCLKRVFSTADTAHRLELEPDGLIYELDAPLHAIAIQKNPAPDGNRPRTAS